MSGKVTSSTPMERIIAIAKYLGMGEQDITLGAVQSHGVTITADTASGYLGLKPSKDITIAVVTGHTILHVEEELREEHLTSATALIIRNDSIPHVHICLCHDEDIARIEQIGRAA